MLRPRRVARLAPTALAAALCCAIPVQALPHSFGSGATVNAIWRIQQLDFIYSSRDIAYSCRALQSKIRAILHAVGAHRQIAVDAGCSNEDFVRHAFVNVTLALPTEATPEAVMAATTFDSREQLIAHMRKLRLPTGADIERFPAAWQAISLARHDGVRLESGDCDLMRDIRDQLFPKLSIRVAPGGLRCSSGTTTRIRPRFDVTALMPAQAPEAADATDRPTS